MQYGSRSNFSQSLCHHLLPTRRSHNPAALIGSSRFGTHVLTAQAGRAHYGDFFCASMMSAHIMSCEVELECHCRPTLQGW